MVAPKTDQLLLHRPFLNWTCPLWPVDCFLFPCSSIWTFCSHWTFFVCHRRLEETEVEVLGSQTSSDRLLQKDGPRSLRDLLATGRPCPRRFHVLALEEDHLEDLVDGHLEECPTSRIHCSTSRCHPHRVCRRGRASSIRAGEQSLWLPLLSKNSCTRV